MSVIIFQIIPYYCMASSAILTHLVRMLKFFLGYRHHW